MIRVLILSLIASSTSACKQAFFAHYPQIDLEFEQSVSSKTTLSVSNITLRAREEKLLPPGATPNPNRDIGFASVFLRLENLNLEKAKLIVKKIEIRNTFNHQVQMVDLSPQEIHLRPLENREESFEITNKTGYFKYGQVKALITYQTGDIEEVIESKPVAIERL